MMNKMFLLALLGGAAYAGCAPNPKAVTICRNYCERRGCLNRGRNCALWAGPTGYLTTTKCPTESPCGRWKLDGNSMCVGGGDDGSCRLDNGHTLQNGDTKVFTAKHRPSTCKAKEIKRVRRRSCTRVRRGWSYRRRCTYKTAYVCVVGTPTEEITCTNGDAKTDNQGRCSYTNKYSSSSKRYVKRMCDRLKL